MDIKSAINELQSTDTMRIINQTTELKTNLFWSRKERRKWFFTLLYGTCLLYANRSSMPLLMPAISEEKHWSKTDSGTIMSSFFWGYTLTQVASGFVSDRIGGQKVIIFAGIGWSLTTYFMPQIITMVSNEASVTLVTIVRTLDGAFQGMHFPSMISLTSQRLQESDRASFFSLLTTGSALGTLLTGSLGSYLLDNYNWSKVFQVLGGLSLVWIGVLSYYSASLVQSTSSLNKSSTLDPLPWFKLFSKIPFWSCVFCHACQNNCFFVLLSWMPTYFHDTFPEVQGWIVNIVPWLSLVPCTFLAKSISERLIKSGFGITATRKIVESICLITESIGLLVLASVSTFQSAIFCLALIIGSAGFHNNAVAVNPSDLAPKHSGSAFGLMNTVGAIPGFLGVYVAGRVLEVTHSWSVVFVITSTVNILGCVTYLMFGSGNAVI